MLRRNSSNHFGIITRNDLLFFFGITRSNNKRKKEPVGRNLGLKELRNVLEVKKKTIFSDRRTNTHKHDAQTSFFSSKEMKRVAGREKLHRMRVFVTQLTSESSITFELKVYVEIPVKWTQSDSDKRNSFPFHSPFRILHQHKTLIWLNNFFFSLFCVTNTPNFGSVSTFSYEKNSSTFYFLFLISCNWFFSLFLF